MKRHAYVIFDASGWPYPQHNAREARIQLKSLDRTCGDVDGPFRLVRYSQPRVIAGTKRKPKR